MAIQCRCKHVLGIEPVAHLRDGTLLFGFHHDTPGDTVAPVVERADGGFSRAVNVIDNGIGERPELKPLRRQGQHRGRPGWGATHHV